MNPQLAAILADVFGLRASEVRPEMEQVDIGTWDSLKQMDLVMSLEREYAIELDIPDIVQMNSIATIMTVLKNKGVHLGD